MRDKEVALKLGILKQILAKENRLKNHLVKCGISEEHGYYRQFVEKN